MNNIGLLEVLVKNIKSESSFESEYDTAVDVVNYNYIDTTYVLQVYKDYFIKITKTDTTISKEEIWPEDNYAIHSSNTPSRTSTSFKACSYFDECGELNEECEFQLKICETLLSSVIKEIENKQNQTVMIPFPRDVITTLFNDAFKYRLEASIDNWKNEIVVAA